MQVQDPCPYAYRERDCVRLRLRSENGKGHRTTRPTQADEDARQRHSRSPQKLVGKLPGLLTVRRLRAAPYAVRNRLFLLEFATKALDKPLEEG